MTQSHGAYSHEEASSYDRDREREPLWEIENNYVASLVERHPGARILDVPVGTGRFLPLYRGHTVIGADLSKAMLRQTRYRDLPELDITLIEASITALPLDTSTFDLVVCWRILHLLPPVTLTAVFAELSRVCSGTLCVQCYLPASPAKRFGARLWRALRRAAVRLRGERNLTPWSHITSYGHLRSSIEAAAQAAGLRLEKWEKLGHYEGTDVVAMEWSQ